MSIYTEQAERLQYLKDFFLEIYNEYASLEKESKHIYHQYYFLFGEAIYKRYHSYVLCLRLRRKLELCRMRINRQETVDYGKIEEELDRELEEHFERLESFLKEYIDSKQYFLGTPVTDENVREIRRIFYKIAKRIHPDLAGEFTEAKKDIWEKVQDAYKRNDLEAMAEYEYIVDNLFIEDAEIDVKHLTEEIDKLERIIEEYKQKSKNIIESFPYNLKGLLHDDYYVKSELEKLTAEGLAYRKRAEEYLSALSDIIPVS